MAGTLHIPVNILVSGGVNSAPGIKYDLADVERCVRANKPMPSGLACRRFPDSNCARAFAP
jgi:hypothetical protein